MTTDIHPYGQSLKNILKLEEAAMFGISIYFLIHFQVDWWCYLLLIFGPDISMLGYVGGSVTGAACYNIFHHKGIAIAIVMAGFLWPNTALTIAGIILFGHSSMDRMFDYGLKTNEGFKYTHLGIIGTKKI